MIQKLRRKFVAICMLLVTAILAVVFLSVFFSMRQNIETISRQVLHQVAQESAFGMDTGGIRRPKLGIEIDGDRVLLPYFTLEIWGSRAYVTGGTYANLEDTKALDSILQACLAENETEGVLKDYRMRYLRQDKGLYQKLTFVDTSMESAMLRNMMGPYLLTALVALALLFGVSVLLSRWAVRPVEKAWRQQRQFLSDASHELKTPLTVILSNAELLEAAPLETRPERWVDNIHTEAVQMKTLVEEMLTLARADDSSHPTERSPLSLSELAAGCALTFESVAFEAGKPLEFELAEGVTVWGNHDQLRRLISILLDNAIKYGAEGAPVRMTLQRGDRQAVLTVSNTGDPIPPEHLPHLFERFYRVDASRGETAGFGLGLAIAKSITEEHKASLWAESDAISTRFIFTIPIKR